MNRDKNKTEDIKVEIINKNNNHNNQHNPSEKPKTKIGLQIFLVFIILIAVIGIIFSLGDVMSIFDVLSKMRIDYLIYTIILALSGFVSFSLAGYVPLRVIAPESDKLNGYLINSTEQFFNGITPFGAGSQPFQIYYMIKEGVPANKATSVTMVNFVIYQTIISILAILAMIFFYSDIYASMGSSIIFLFLGFTLNTLILLFFIVLTLFKKTSLLFEGVIKWLGRFKFMKKRTNKWLLNTKTFISSFQEGFKFLMGKKRVFIASVLLKLVGLFFQYSTVIILALSLGFKFNFEQNIYLILVSMLSFTVMMWIPLPGSSGGIEWIFSLLVLPLFLGDSNVVLSLLLLWRVVTYYLAVIYGGIGYFTLIRRSKKKEI